MLGFTLWVQRPAWCDVHFTIQLRFVIKKTNNTQANAQTTHIQMEKNVKNLETIIRTPWINSHEKNLLSFIYKYSRIWKKKQVRGWGALGQRRIQLFLTCELSSLWVWPNLLTRAWVVISFIYSAIIVFYLYVKALRLSCTPLFSLTSPYANGNERNLPPASPV